MSIALKTAVAALIIPSIAIIFYMSRDEPSTQIMTLTRDTGITTASARPTLPLHTSAYPDAESPHGKLEQSTRPRQHNDADELSVWAAQPELDSATLDGFLPPVPEGSESAPTPAEGLTGAVQLAALGLNTNATLPQFQLSVDRILQERAALTSQLKQTDTEHSYELGRLDDLQHELKRIRDTIGDEGYDSRLFAAGKPNRVVISTDTSEAALAIGFAPGDVIVAYNGQRVFDSYEVQAMDHSVMDQSESTVEKEMVQINLIRAGELIEITAPRGLLQEIETATQSTNPLR